HPLPPGAQGELYIGGVQLADGYINQTALSAERFLPLPGTLKSFPIEGNKLYRTGDLVRLTAENGLEFLGRIDHQVKIRGLRIELGEIETQLMVLPQVKSAVVSTHRDNSDQAQLVGYIVLDVSDEAANVIPDIQSLLSKVLPDYMIPAQWVILSSLPYLSNGKVNRNALPKPEILPASDSYTDELTAQESLVATVWQKVLKHAQILPDVPFYSLGGDSMMAIRVRSALEREGFSLDLAALFRNPTVRQVARLLVPVSPQLSVSRSPFSLLSHQDKQQLPPGLEDAYPLSAMQKSMAWQAEIERDSSVYRVVTSLTLELPLDGQLLQQAIEETYRRHPLLRSSFDQSNYSEPIQLVHHEVSVDITAEESLSHLTEQQQQQFIQHWVEQAKLHYLDLNKAPCLAFYTHQLSPQRFQLSVIEHHVVLDGWSDLVMLDEIIENYRDLRENRQPQHAVLTSHYRDFVAAEQEIIQNKNATAFWQSKLAELNPAPLPRAEKTGNTWHKRIQASLPTALCETLQTLVVTHQLPLKTLLIAAHLKVQAVLTGQKDVATGLIFNARPASQDADKMIGVFLNTLPLALSIEQESFIDLARRVQQFEAEAWPWGLYPFTAMQRDYGQEIVLDSYINYMDFHRNWGATGSVVSQAFGVADTNFALAVNYLMDPVSENLSLWFDCNLGQLSEAMCDLLPQYYLKVLQQMAEDPLQYVFASSLLPREQYEQIQQWNNTVQAYERDYCAYRQFEHQAKHFPDREALCCRDQSVSYAELNQIANAMAIRLQKAGVTSGVLVGVCLRRSVELVAHT
ncbi:condensation domain-containing protein, partial [Xenorhabdus sp. IM139775]|uniref:condensation domain-containing protein n=1 Tax=Xenorhabdus sp. IM139775 TaxID=3025876 RepID=UPI0023596A95